MDAGSTGAVDRPGEALATSGPPTPPRPAPGQIDATLDHLERLCGRLEQAEARFKQLTDECEGVLHGLVAVDRRHSSVIAGLNERLGDWCHLEGRLLEESARRIEQFERGVGHEWQVIRQLHEEPLAQIREQADQLRQSCLEAARLARFRLDSAEQAYTSYAADLERRMAEWSRDVVKAAGSREPWPLEGVAQLHHELRSGVPAQPALPALPARLERADARAAGADEQALQGAIVATADAAGRAPTPAKAKRRLPAPPVLVAATLVGLVLLSAVIYGLRRGPAATAGRPPAAPTAITAAAQPPPAAAASAAPDDRLVEAQRAAERAGAMVEILAAPDLRRYALAGVSASDAPQPYGQLLWSRSRGLAVSASRLPALPSGKVYQLWIVPDGPPVAAGALAPDAAGRASLLLAGPLKLPLPVTIRVTIEDRGQVTSPQGPVCLARVPTT